MIPVVPQKAIEDFINTVMQDSEDVFLVEVKVNPGNNIKVFLDADNGITIEKCVQINRALYNRSKNRIFSKWKFFPGSFLSRCG